MYPIDRAVQIAAKLAKHTGDPLYASAAARLAPYITTSDPPVDEIYLSSLLAFVEKAERHYLALYGKPILDE